MSDSRLEKFIYAICSMDVSDLPVPLSRIEKLWNCLITGETPDFEPLSRNEKYLMAMLNYYDISNLPTPMSRGEKLLYKIAVGETDLSDVPGYLSRYEELLKYLIKNGGISGGDFEYVLHTLNQSLNTLYLTAEKPVKSAILTGQTLVNLADYDGYEYVNYNCFISLKYKATSNIYTIFNYSDKVLQILDENDGLLAQPKANSVELLNSNTLLKIKGSSGYGWRNNGEFQKSFIVLEGDYTNQDIPYFEGMQSVKMPVLTTTGKNLFDGELEIGGLSTTNGLPNNTQLDRHRSKNYTKVKSSTKYVVYNNYSSTVGIREFDKDYNFVSWSSLSSSSNTFTTSNNAKYLKFIIINTNDDNLLQLEEGSVATQYEPYKTNILTVNEEVELRGIDDVRDKLDLISGEIIESIGEGVLNGGEEWIFNTPKEQPNHWCFHNDQKLAGEKLLISDRFPQSDIDGDRESIRGGGNFIFVYISKEKVEGNINSFKQWLSQNPIKYQYRKSEKSIKTVDLTVVDQDNQPTQLGTFENVTHVSLEAENLIPEVEMEVATNLLEDTVFTLMDDISNEQQQLETTIDEQSENVDATMIATTEIYEETL